MTNSFDFNKISQHPDGAADNTANMPSPHSPNQQDAAGHSAASHHSGNVTVYATTGPDAYSGPILAAGSSTPALNPRSCVTCRRRKVRCDKQMPCSNCRRAQIPCVFPAPGRAPRQPRPKDPNAPPKSSSQREVELVKRLKKLEGIVEELSGQIDDPSGRLPSSTGSPDFHHAGADTSSQRHMSASLDQAAGQVPSPKGTESSAGSSSDAGKLRETSKKFGRLVLDDHRGTSRYVSSGFWSKLNDELDAIREETQRLTDEDIDDSDYEGTPTDSPATGTGIASDHHSFVLGYRSADVDLQKLHPLPSHATFLWSVYQENVEPLVKMLHVPTADVIFREARKGSSKLTPGNEALVFAIYFAAITSLEPEEVQTNFGASHEELFSHYRFALEQALAKANFLDTSDLAVLQAFTLFLVVVRRHDESRFCWALTGLLIRIAQGMGLHRDGTHLKLSPFETEIRRRIWWAILVLDLRSAEELGTDMTIGEGSYDTLKPSNINDADISPESTEFPPSREGRSDSAVAIVRCEICGLSRRLVAAAGAMSPLCPNMDHSTIAERERMLIELYQRVEHKFLKHVLDETDPLYWVAAMIARVIVAKMCLVIYQPMLFPGSEFELSDEIRQRIYVAAIEVIEYNHKLNTDPRCKQYRWLFKTYTNWHAIAYTLIETCRRPWTALVERGWDAVTGYDMDPLELAKKADHAAVFLPLRKLFAKARKHREAELVRLRANPEEARRLDFAERMNPAQARFGPVPGAENKMEQMREKWWTLVRANGTTPEPWMGSGQASISQQQTPLTTQANGSQQASNATAGNIPLQLNVSNAAMEYMDQLMAQPNANMTEFWKLDNLSRDASQLATTTPPMGGPLQNQMSEQDVLRQQAMTLQMQPPKDGSLAPYLWSDPFTSMNTKFDNVMEDTDMLGDDFDWQDWSQSIRGLEMESTQDNDRW